MTQAHWHPEAIALMKRRKEGGDSGLEALRVLKRALSNVVYAALRADLLIRPALAAA
jgi:transposase